MPASSSSSSSMVLVNEKWIFCGGISTSYATGICFILSVSVIWAASSMLIQYIYTDTHNTFHSPFLVTYIGVSLFTLWLPTHHCCTITSYIIKTITNGHDKSSHMTNHSSPTTVVYETLPLENDISTCIDVDSSIDDSESDVDNNYNDGNDPSIQRSTAVATNSNSNTTIWTEYDHIRTAMYIAPVWFIANWCYNTSLIYTTITSSTVLASTGSLFTYIFAICTNDEQLTSMKFTGVLFGVLGSFITTLSDTESPTNETKGNVSLVSSSNDDFSYDTVSAQLATTSIPSSDHSSSSTTSILPILGDMLGLISAIGYGAYAVQTRIYCPKDESLYSMQLVLGYIGLWNMIILSPFTIYLFVTGQANISWMIFGFLVLKGLLDNVLSDYLWLRAVMLTNATTATVGLGCTIPLAFVSDVMLGKESGVISTEQITGALVVLVGFVLVNVSNNTNSTTPTNNIHGPHHDNDATNIPVNRLQQYESSYHDDNISQRGQEIVSLPVHLHSVS